MNRKIERLFQGTIDIKDYDAEERIKKGESIIISLEGRAGKMIIAPEELISKRVRVSPKPFKSIQKNSKHPSYYLWSYKWEPNLK